MIKKILLATTIFLILDSVWIMIFAQSLYQSHLAEYISHTNGIWQVNYISCVLVYLFLIVGMVLFPIAKAQNNWKKGFGWGLVFGASTYGTYAFTNHALLKNWPLIIAISDVLWGCVICAITSALTIKFSSK